MARKVVHGFSALLSIKNIYIRNISLERKKNNMKILRVLQKKSVAAAGTLNSHQLSCHKRHWIATTLT